MFSTSIKLWLCTLIFLIPWNGWGNQPSNERDSLQGVEFYRRGVEFGREGEPEKALEQFRQSVEYRKRAFGEKHIRLAASYMGIAIQYKNLRQLDDAFRYFKLAEEVYQLNLSANDSRLGDVYSNIGNYFRIKGNLGEAIRYQERAVYIFEHSPDDFPENNYLSAVYNLADIYHQVDREQEALALATRFSEKGSFGLRVNWLNLTASIYTSMGDLSSADKIYNRVINRIKEEYGEQDADLADQYLSYAQFLNISGNQEYALPFLRKAESIYQRYRNRQGDLADLYNIVADSYAQKKVSSSSWEDFRRTRYKNLQLATEWNEKALRLLTGSDGIALMEKNLPPDRETFRENNFPMATLTTLGQLGQNCLQLAQFSPQEEKNLKTGYLKKAAALFIAGSDMADYLRTGFVTDESKIQFNTLQQNIFQGAVEAAYELYLLTQDQHWVEIAFRHAENNKAASLLDQISEVESRSGGVIPDSLLNRESEATTRLAWYREKLYLETVEEVPNTQKISEYRQRIFEIEEMILKLREDLGKDYPEYYRVKYEETPLSFELARKSMKKDDVLLSYSLELPREGNEGQLYIIALSTSGYRFIRQPFTQQHLEMVTTIFQTLADPGYLNTGREQFSAYCKSAFDLYRLLLFPFEEIISDKKITVTPDGILNYLPFEALLTESADLSTVHFHDLSYLILRHTVSYGYSAALFSKGNKKGGRRSVAFAPVYLGDAGPAGTPSALPSIPGALQEVTLMSKKLRTTLYQGERATESKFREVAGQYDILHLAMHTLINDSLPLFSKLAFASGDPGNLEDDGWLNAADVYTLHMKARMAVLGACRSGGGTLRNGEGIISLARGFFYAGCRSVVLSLWEVEDQAGAQIMKEFYRNLKAGRSKDQALRNAKLKYLREASPVTAHPRLWLGYILIGDQEPLFGGIRIYLLVFMGLILLLIAADMVIKKPAGDRPAGDRK